MTEKTRVRYQREEEARVGATPPLGGSGYVVCGAHIVIGGSSPPGPHLQC